MTNQALPGRPPAHDLSAFDLSKRSPEQVARSFVHWKAQRKRQPEAGPARADPLPSPQPEPAPAETASGGDASAQTAPQRTTAKRANAVQYSATFSDLLAAGSEPTVQRTSWAPVAALRAAPRPASGRGLKLMSMLAGAASVVALAGGALLELADWRDPVEIAPAPPVAQVRPPAIPAVGSLAVAASSVPAVAWTLPSAVDLALMKAPATPAIRPAPEIPKPTVQTASKASPVAADRPVLPERKSAAPATVQFVAKPFVPNAAPVPIAAAQGAAVTPAASVSAKVHAGDPRPDALFQHGRDNRTGTVSNRAASNGKPETGSVGTVDTRPASARNSAVMSSSTVANGGKGDPRGEGTGGARVGIASEAGAGMASTARGAGSGKSAAGDPGNASTDGSADAAGATDGGGDTGGAAAGDNGAGGAGSGDADTGSSGDGDSGEGGESDGIGGALGAVGDALGGAVGGKNKSDSDDKDQKD